MESLYKAWTRWGADHTHMQREPHRGAQSGSRHNQSVCQRPPLKRSLQPAGQARAVRQRVSSTSSQRGADLADADAVAQKAARHQRRVELVGHVQAFAASVGCHHLDGRLHHVAQAHGGRLQHHTVVVNLQGGSAGRRTRSGGTPASRGLPYAKSARPSARPAQLPHDRTLEKSRMSPRIVSSVLPLSRMVSVSSRCSGVSPLDSSSCSRAARRRRRWPEPERGS